MMEVTTLRRLESDIIEALQINSAILGVASDSIQAGRYGELPAEPPAIWVYCEPASFDEGESVSLPWALAEIFVCMPGDNASDSKFDALEAAERCRAVFENEEILYCDKVIEFDGNYENFAVAVLSMKSLYKYSA
jgi:hypothetical protein